MARQHSWYGRPEVAGTAANLVTVSDIACRAGSPAEAAAEWTRRYDFPVPLVPEAAGGAVWWWPDIRGYIDRHPALPGYVPPPPVRPAARPRPKGKRGREPGPSVLGPFEIRQIEAMRGQVNDHGRPRFTLSQIAAALPGEVTAATVWQYSPDKGQHRPYRPRGGGDEREVSPAQIARMRELRAETRSDGRRKYTQRQIAAMFGVSDATVGRHTGSSHGEGSKDAPGYRAVVTLMTSDPDLTAAQIVDRTGLALATVRQYLRYARRAAESAPAEAGDFL